MTTEDTAVRSSKSKRKPFNSNAADYLLIIATFAFSYPRVSSDTPSFAAFTPVAPDVRFNALAIFLTPIFCFAGDFNSRTSFLVHSRLTTFFFAFLAMSAPVVEPGSFLERFHFGLYTPARERFICSTSGEQKE
jgi:hypothetical protein